MNPGDPRTVRNPAGNIHHIEGGLFLPKGIGESKCGGFKFCSAIRLDICASRTGQEDGSRTSLFKTDGGFEERGQANGEQTVATNDPLSAISHWAGLLPAFDEGDTPSLCFKSHSPQDSAFRAQSRSEQDRRECEVPTFRKFVPDRFGWFFH